MERPSVRPDNLNCQSRQLTDEQTEKPYAFQLQETLKNANAKDVEDTDRMKVFTMRYFDIVKVNLADMAPKIIIQFLVKKSI